MCKCYILISWLLGDVLLRGCVTRGRGMLTAMGYQSLRDNQQLGGQLGGCDAGDPAGWM